MVTVNLHRLRLQPRGATLSPWQADTLFGHFCWAVLHEKGEAELQEFIAPFRRREPPFVLSDGFPGDLFPRPLLPPPHFAFANKAERERARDEAKETKGLSWLTEEQFGRVLCGAAPGLGQGFGFKPPPQRLVLKNQINRLTGTTAGADTDGEQGNLYAVEEHALYRGKGVSREPMPISIYFWAKDDDQVENLKQLFETLARGGYGKKKSAGYGQFAVLGCEAFAFSVPDHANGVLALANFVPARADPRDGFYRTRIKYGKLGEAGILDGKPIIPWKFPLLMLAAGSTFYCNDPKPHFVGRLVSPVHRDNTSIVHSGFAPVLPIRLTREGA